LGLENLNSIFNDLSDPPDISGRHDGKATNSALDGISSFPIVDPSNLKKQLGRISADNSVSGIINISQPLDNASWESLYTSVHAPLDGVSTKPRNVNPIQPYIYGGKVDRDNLNIRDGGRTRRASIFSPSRGSLIGLGDEPYIISPIATSEGVNGGRAKNQGSQSIPIIRAVTDTIRLTSFLSSPAGLAFILKQNLLGIVGSQAQWAPPSFNGEAANGLIVSPGRFGHLYNPLSTLGSSLARVLGSGAQGGVPNALFRRDFLIGDRGFTIGPIKNGEWDRDRSITIEQFGDYSKAYSVYSLHSTFGGYNQWSADENGPLIDKAKYFPTAKGARFRNNDSEIKSGDKMTLADLIKGKGLVSDDTKTQGLGTGGTLLADETIPVRLESHLNGMPFYFKDLRDDNYIFFRAYVDGISENLSPNWAPTNYIGRSEPVYTYERAEREVTFNLKLYANTPDELNMIYKKINRLTSLCYPQYKSKNNMLRMKPPLTKMRMGELFGSQNNEMTGFIKSLSYTVPEESPWETGVNRRVPKYVIATISYQIIHGTVPQLHQQVYGLEEVEDEEGNTTEVETEQTIDYDFYNRTDTDGYNNFYGSYTEVV
tara:strand:+ start:5252 stop:7048 length:1797 start_codon:yes stop_codon:yes gene_type:complete